MRKLFKERKLFKGGNYMRKYGKCFGMRYLLSAIPRIFFQPAKFDNFKDEKISDCKTVSVPKRKNLLD